jgi:hypothetical protein
VLARKLCRARENAPSRDDSDTRRFCFALWEDFRERGANTKFENAYESVTPGELA